jgi:hypothetical protein
MQDSTNPDGTEFCSVETETKQLKAEVAVAELSPVLVPETRNDRIPREDLEALTAWVLEIGMLTFCLELFPEGRQSRKYWEVYGKYQIRISLETGGFFDLNKPHLGFPIPGSCPLTLWLMRYNWSSLRPGKTTPYWCSKGTVLRSAFRKLSEWCATKEERKEQFQINAAVECEKRFLQEMKELKEIVYIALFQEQEGITSYKESAKSLWGRVVAFCGEECKTMDHLATHWKFREALEYWADTDKEFFTVKKTGWETKTKFVLESAL